MRTTQTLIGYLWNCGDSCCCSQPVIEELRKKGSKEENRERIWEGTFLYDPSPREEQMLLEELEEACRKHLMKPSELDPQQWEREIQKRRKANGNV